MKLNRITKRIVIVAGILVLVFLVLNGQAYWERWKPKQPVSVPTAEQAKGEPNRVIIPSLGITVPLKYVSEANEDVFQRALQDGVVHYPGTAKIGQYGNPYIFGHSSDFAFGPGNYKTVFAPLVDIENGAEVVVTDEQGIIYTYVVKEHFIAEKDDVHLLDQRGYQQKLLTLQTSYPIGTALRRYIVIAELKQ